MIKKILKWLKNLDKALLKTLSWRAVASTDTLVVAWFITGSFAVAGSIMGVEVITKMVLYYLHEKGWERWWKDE